MDVGLQHDKGEVSDVAVFLSHVQRQRWFVSFVEWFLRISFCYLVYLVLGTC